MDIHLNYSLRCFHSDSVSLLRSLTRSRSDLRRATSCCVSHMQSRSLIFFFFRSLSLYNNRITNIMLKQTFIIHTRQRAEAIFFLLLISKRRRSNNSSFVFLVSLETGFSFVYNNHYGNDDSVLEIHVKQTKAQKQYRINELAYTYTNFSTTATTTCALHRNNMHSKTKKVNPTFGYLRELRLVDPFTIYILFRPKCVHGKVKEFFVCVDACMNSPRKNPN